MELQKKFGDLPQIWQCLSIGHLWQVTMLSEGILDIINLRYFHHYTDDLGYNGLYKAGLEVQPRPDCTCNILLL